VNIKYKIRPAGKDDAYEIAKIHINSWRATYSGIVPDSYLDFLDYERSARNFVKSFGKGSRRVYVIEDEANIRGFCTIYDMETGYHQKNITAEINAIYLAPEYIGKGFGPRLLSYVIEELKSENYTSVILWVLADNVKARLFYEGMGFRNTGETKPIEIGKTLLTIKYRMTIKSK